jgi:hypothetical protein
LTRIGHIYLVLHRYVYHMYLERAGERAREREREREGARERERERVSERERERERESARARSYTRINWYVCHLYIVTGLV